VKDPGRGPFLAALLLFATLAGRSIRIRFVATVFTFFGVDLLLTGLHSYG
jgi:ABC-type transport system involved in cytochrome c biogenesis permease subunit